MSIKVFVSSSYKDFEFLRDTLWENLHEMKCTPICFEKDAFPVSPGGTIIQAIEKQVNESDLMILLIGEMNSEYTQYEYEAAFKAGKVILPFIKIGVSQLYDIYKKQPEFISHKYQPKEKHQPNLREQLKFISLVEKNQGDRRPLIPFIDQKDLIKALQTHFDYWLKEYLEPGDPILPVVIYKSQFNHVVRKIRIQAHTSCTQRCPWCHNDEFIKDEEGTPDTEPDAIMRICKGLVEGRVEQTFPWEEPYFVLSGGEPLLNPDLVLKLSELSPKTTTLVTNANRLTETVLNKLPKDLRGIRISHNPFNRDCITILGKGGRKIKEKYWEKTYENVKRLLETEIPMRFNTVITKEGDFQIDKYIESIASTFGSARIGTKIKGIAFIQASRIKSGSKERNIEGDFDIFKLADEWAKEKNAKNEYKDTPIVLHDVPGALRRKVVDGFKKLRIEFIKVNCDDKTDCIRRCFDCVREKDVSITADGRVRVCKRWKENLDPIYDYAYIDASNPMSGIKSMIRKQYAFVGFFGHFPILAKILRGEPVNRMLDKKNLISDEDLQSVIKSLSLRNYSMKDFESFIDFYQEIIPKVLKKKSSIMPLWKEGQIDRPVLMNSSNLCILLVKDAYRIARMIRDEGRDNNFVDISTIEKKEGRLNFVLILLVYLCVDEMLFSKISANLVKGTTKALLYKFSKGDFDEKFLERSTYVIGSIALENEKGETVRMFIEDMLTNKLIEDSSIINYLLGFILNREKKFNEAEKRFRRALYIAKKELLSRPSWDDMFDKLNREVRCESYRGIASAIKEQKDSTEDHREYYLKANFYATKDKAASLYSSFFSDGYQALRRYFECESELRKNSMDGYEAHLKLNLSVHFQPDFYASLIRLSLLELVLGEVQDSYERLKDAKKVFSNKGLLTDQEFLNSLLCDQILHVAKIKSQEDSEVPSIKEIDINHCYKTVDERDIQCVQRDAGYLLNYLQDEDHNDLDSRQLERLNLAIENLECFIDEKLNPLIEKAAQKIR